MRKKGPALRLISMAVAVAALAGPTGAAPLPTPKPDTATLGPPADIGVPPPVSVEDAAVAAVRTAVSALDIGDFTGAMEAVAYRPPIERDVVLWLAIRRQVPELTPQLVTDFAKRNPHWPSASLFRRRAEQAMARMNLSAADVVAEYGRDVPLSEEGMLALVAALVELGRKEDAAKLLRPFWASDGLGAGSDQLIIARWADLLDKPTHKARYDRLMYDDRIEEAEIVAPFLGKEWSALAAARRAVLRNAGDADKKLALVTGPAKDDPLYAFTLAERLRRDGRDGEAADVLVTVPAASVLPHADAWWVERRIVSRGLVEAGHAGKAYALVAVHRGGNPETVAEAHFHAGWYALRFLKDPGRARPHFQALQAAVTLPISRARAAYWLGRTEAAARNPEEARRHYTVAASDEATFYGQLARVELRIESLDLPPVPEPTDVDRGAFAANDMAKAATLLVQAGARGEAAPLITELARQLPSGGQVALLTDWLERLGDHRAALQVGKLAADRNLGTESLAFPLEALPPSGRGRKKVETAMIYAIARQESAFDPAAVSHAGAMGLLQLLPTTAQATAKTLGLPFSRPRLTTDADYNATLGSAHLRELLGDFGGSYILTFAAYNAGPRKAREWVRRFGDPRDPAVDPVDWIELIPYGETRSYVQRVTENMQVYRERLSGSKLLIAEDLRRGRLDQPVR
jgi:soluble lytic murein transglycosylase